MTENGKTHLLAAEAAALLHVSPKTMTRYAKEGKVSFTMTLGGHRRFPRSEIEALARSLRRDVEAGR